MRENESGGIATFPGSEATFQGRTGEVNSAIFSPDARRVSFGWTAAGSVQAGCRPTREGEGNLFDVNRGLSISTEKLPRSRLNRIKLSLLVFRLISTIFKVFSIYSERKNCKATPGPSHRPIEVRFSAPSWLRRSVFSVAI